MLLVNNVLPPPQVLSERKVSFVSIKEALREKEMLVIQFPKKACLE